MGLFSVAEFEVANHRSHQRPSVCICQLFSTETMNCRRVPIRKLILKRRRRGAARCCLERHAFYSLPDLRLVEGAKLVMRTQASGARVDAAP